MPGLKQLKWMGLLAGGTVAGVSIGLSAARKDPSIENSEDRGQYAASAGMLGGLVAAGVGLYGINRLTKTGFWTANKAGRGLYRTGKMLTANPVRGVWNKMGRTKFGLSSTGILKTPLSYMFMAAGMTVATGVGMSMSSPETSAYASPDGMGGYDYNDMSTNQASSISDRLRSLGADGNVVFGLHNTRHSR